MDEIVNKSDRRDDAGADWTKEESDEIVRTLKEIVQEGGSLAGLDIEVGSEVKYCGFRFEKGKPQFYHIGWSSESRVSL